MHSRLNPFFTCEDVLAHWFLVHKTTLVKGWGLGTPGVETTLVKGVWEPSGRDVEGKEETWEG